jgi:hypothetical protein
VPGNGFLVSENKMVRSETDFPVPENRLGRRENGFGASEKETGRAGFEKHFAVGGGVAAWFCHLAGQFPGSGRERGTEVGTNFRSALSRSGVEKISSQIFMRITGMIFPKPWQNGKPSAANYQPNFALPKTGSFHVRAQSRSPKNFVPGRPGG